MYERVPANNDGQFSSWNANPTIVPKPDQPPDLKNPEIRVTFDYSHVTKDLPGCFLELTEEIHDFLSYLDHGCFIQLDLKHAFWSLPVHKDNRYIFAFIVLGIGQV
jgi:hypothetical protein